MATSASSSSNNNKNDDSIEQHKPKEISPLRLSCDSCRFRKTRCDRKSRLELGEIGCTFCKSMGLLCSITPTATTRKNIPRLGKRIRVLLKDSKDDKKIDNSDQSNCKFKSPIFSRNNSATFSTDKGKGLESQSIILPAVTPFLGVQGLNRAKLDECIQAFFQKLGPCMPLSQSSAIFWPRYHLFLDFACGTSTQLYIGIEPASELLVLAVACRGCGNTELVDRNELAVALSDRFVSLANTVEQRYLVSLDGIEAINLISERVVRPLYSKTKSPLHMDILGRSCSTELALLSNLNIPPPETGLNNEERDRSGFIFWTIFAHDAFRSVAARKMYRIHQEDIGWIPIDQITTRSMPFPNYGKSMYLLALIARSICRNLLSTRSKRFGIPRSTLIETIANLNQWHEDLDQPLQFKWTVDGFDSSLDKDYDAIDLQGKRSFMLTIWLSLYLQIWASLPNCTNNEEISQHEVEIENEILQAYFKMASLARYCVRYDLADCAPNELRNIPAAWSLWYACYIRRAAGLSILISASKIHQLNQACHALVDCVRSAKSIQDSGELATRLVDTISQALSIAEQRLLKGQADNKMYNLDSHSDFILSAADEGMPAFKTNFIFKSPLEERLQDHQPSFQMPFVDNGNNYQSEVLVNNTGNTGNNGSDGSFAIDQVSPLSIDSNFLDMDMQEFLASCGIESSFYKLL